MSIRFCKALMVIVAGLVLWSCSDDEPTPASPDTTPPHVTTTFPSDGDTNVPVDIHVMVGFSEDMSVSSINNQTIQIVGLPGSTVFATNRSATLVPLYDLFYGEEYSVIVTTGVRDVAGNAMAANYTWSFTTEPDTAAPPGR